MTKKMDGMLLHLLYNAQLIKLVVNSCGSIPMGASVYIMHILNIKHCIFML